jgi:hypothetical protein
VCSLKSFEWKIACDMAYLESRNSPVSSHGVADLAMRENHLSGLAPAPLSPRKEKAEIRGCCLGGNDGWPASGLPVASCCHIASYLPVEGLSRARRISFALQTAASLERIRKKGRKKQVHPVRAGDQAIAWPL